MKPIFHKSDEYEGVDMGPKMEKFEQWVVPWVREQDGEFQSGAISMQDLTDAFMDDEVPHFRASHVSKSREGAISALVEGINETRGVEPTILETVDESWWPTRDADRGDTTALRAAVFMEDGFYHSGFLVSSDNEYDRSRQTVHAFLTHEEARADARGLTHTQDSSVHETPPNAIRFGGAVDEGVQKDYDKAGGLVVAYARSKNIDAQAAARDLCQSNVIEPGDFRLAVFGEGGEPQPKQSLAETVSKLEGYLSSKSRDALSGEAEWDVSEDQLRLKALSMGLKKGAVKPEKAAEQLEGWAMAEAKSGDFGFAKRLMRASAVAVMERSEVRKKRVAEAAR